MKILSTIIATMLITTSVCNAQSITISGEETSDKPVEIDRQEPDYKSYYHSRYRNEYVLLSDVRKQVERLRNRIEDNHKYGERKKASLTKDLDFILREILESDINGDGRLNRKEQEVYKSYFYIDY